MPRPRKPDDQVTDAAKRSRRYRERQRLLRAIEEAPPLAPGEEHGLGDGWKMVAGEDGTLTTYDSQGGVVFRSSPVEKEVRVVSRAVLSSSAQPQYVARLVRQVERAARAGWLPAKEVLERAEFARERGASEHSNMILHLLGEQIHALAATGETMGQETARHRAQVMEEIERRRVKVAA